MHKEKPYRQRIEDFVGSLNSKQKAMLIDVINIIGNIDSINHNPEVTSNIFWMMQHVLGAYWCPECKRVCKCQCYMQGN